MKTLVNCFSKKMKLTYLVNARIPTEKAHGIQIMKMCEAFAHSEVKVELIVPFRFNKISQDPFAYYDIKQNFKIVRIPCIDLTALGRFGFYVQSLTFALMSAIYVSVSKSDLFFSRDDFVLFFVSFVRKNIFWESHENCWRAFTLRVTRKIHGLIVTNENLKKFYLEKGVSEKKILVARNGFDYELFSKERDKLSCRKKTGLPMDKNIVLYSGHLYEWKGVHVLAEAASYLPANVVVVFVGGLEQDIKQFKMKYNDFSNIHTIGKKPYSLMSMYQQAADVLVLPNTSNDVFSREYTAPIKMFEYMASGRPIVASRLPSTTEVLGKENAWLCESDNPSALAEAILEVLSSDSETIQTRVSVARKTANKYTWDNRAESIIRFFNEYS